MRDGKQLDGETLGCWVDIDSGLVKITTPGKYPFVAMGDSAKLKKGQWVLATGHPGGYKQGRPPVVRLGRVLDSGKTLVRSDCTLVGGDSGGPLFDMEGKVVGIHSRIMGNITANIHVPVDTYRETWDRLAKGEVCGTTIGAVGRPAQTAPYLGVMANADEANCKISDVTPGSPAEKAGFKVNDVIMKFGDKGIASFEELQKQVRSRKAGDSIAVQVRRGEETVTLNVTLGKRPE